MLGTFFYCFVRGCEKKPPKNVVRDIDSGKCAGEKKKI